MESVADQLRRESIARLRKMTAAERMAEAFSLGDEAIVAYSTAHGIDVAEARRSFERADQAGRLPSRVMLEIIG